MNNIFFTADTHFGGTGIIKYDKRPFANPEEMDEKIIEQWNKDVTKSDRVYHLGDVTFGKHQPYLKRLNGQIHLIKGNHDTRVNKATAKLYRSVSDIKILRSVEPDIIMCHYAMRTWYKSIYGTWQLYGHSHGHLEDDFSLLSFDVGMNLWDYRVIPYEDIVTMMQYRTMMYNRYIEMMRSQNGMV